MKKRTSAIATLFCLAFGLASCALGPKVPPPSPAKIESVQVTTGFFQGRFEAYADVIGSMTCGGAQLLEARQWREGYRLYIELEEQLPVEIPETVVRIPFQQRIPIEISGLAPGVYIVNVNGKEEHLEIDGSGLRPAEDRGQFL